MGVSRIGGEGGGGYQSQREIDRSIARYVYIYIYIYILVVFGLCKESEK